MNICCCSLAGTKACQHCSNNGFEENFNYQPVKNYTATDIKIIENELISMLKIDYRWLDG
jgi:hypothetical protein